jgi:hypothetical protein
MPVSPNDYARRAAELEQLAAIATIPTAKQQYLEIARELRVLAAESAIFEEPSDKAVERLVVHMIGSGHRKL